VNVHIDESQSDGKLLLTHQLQRLLVCVDVYLETFEPKPLAHANDFGLERICSRLTRCLSVCLSVCVRVCGWVWFMCPGCNCQCFISLSCWFTAK